MEQIIKFIGIALLINFWVHFFTPIQTIKNKLFNLLDKIPYVPFYSLNCTKCLGLWIGLGVYWDIFLAVLLSVTTWIIEWILIEVEYKKTN